MPSLRHAHLLLVLTACALVPNLVFAQTSQRRPLDIPDTSHNAPTQHTRLYLKDGSYQLVLDYKIKGQVVQYHSAEREGAPEELPLALVDLPATERWKRQHAAGAPVPEDQSPVLTPELAKEEADRAALTPVIFEDSQQALRLPDLLSVLALDTYQSTPELVPLAQQGSDLNKETAHAVLPQLINPASAPHRITEVPHYAADVQLHVPDPVFYVRIGPDDSAPATGATFTVKTNPDTSANTASRPTPSGGDASSGYVIERLDVRYQSRVVDSFRISWLGTGRTQPDVIEMKQETLPGGHWLKLTPATPLEFGEYALIEVLSERDLNLNVWDFGIHSDAKENPEAIRPDPKRPITLQRR